MSRSSPDISDLNHRIEENTDPRECWRLVQERIQEIRQSGQDVPEDLSLIAHRLMRDCMEQSQGR